MVSMNMNMCDNISIMRKHIYFINRTSTENKQNYSKTYSRHTSASSWSLSTSSNIHKFIVDRFNNGLVAMRPETVTVHISR